MSEQIIKVIGLVPGNVHPLVTVQAATLDSATFWAMHVHPHQPVLIKGATRHWRATEHWHRPGYLESLCGDERVELSRAFNTVPALFSAALRFEKLVDCLAEMRKADSGMTYSIPAIAAPARWETELGTYDFLGRHAHRRPLGSPKKRLFVYKNASTEWHYHALDETITGQLAGSKRISLFRLSPQNWHAYAPIIEANLHHLPCAHSFFPAPEQLVKYEGVIEAGDAVYIPPFWWHGIDTDDDQVGVTVAHCFRSPLNRFGDWREPATRDLIRTVARSHKTMLLPLLALLSGSHLQRRVCGEPWMPATQQ